MKNFLIYSVEDDPNINELYEELLGEIECVDMLCFANPRICLEHIKDPANDPDLIIVDLSMPIMNGVEFLQELKATKSKAKTIVVSGNADKESAIKVVNLGAINVFEKPFNYQYLKSTCLNIAANKKCEELEKHFQNIYEKFYLFSKKMKNHLDIKIIQAENQVYVYETSQTVNPIQRDRNEIISDIAKTKTINKEFEELNSLIEEYKKRISFYKKMGV